MKKLAICLVILSVSSVRAESRTMDEPAMMKEKKVDALVSELGLTDDQKKKIQASRDKFKAQISEKQSAFNTARDKFAQMVQNPTATTSDLENVYKQQEDSHRALQDVIFKSRMEFRDALTPEQRTKMVTKRDDRRGPMPSPLTMEKTPDVRSVIPNGAVPPPVPVMTK